MIFAAAVFWWLIVMCIPYSYCDSGAIRHVSTYGRLVVALLFWRERSAAFILFLYVLLRHVPFYCVRTVGTSALLSCSYTVGLLSHCFYLVSVDLYRTVQSIAFLPSPIDFWRRLWQTRYANNCVCRILGVVVVYVRGIRSFSACPAFAFPSVDTSRSRRCVPPVTVCILVSIPGADTVCR